MSSLSARAGLLVLFAVLAALLLGACGGGDDETSGDAGSNAEYEAHIQPVMESFANGFDELSADAANPTSPKDFRDSVIAIQDRITETVDELVAITPPEDLAADHAELIQTFAEYRDGYDPIVEALDADDQQALQEAAANIPQVVKDFQTSYTEIQSRMSEAGVEIEVGETETPTDTTTESDTESTEGTAVPAP